MAYTIISQNNTTTTLQDENGNIIYVPGRVTLATSTDYTITEVNNNTATLTDGSGKVIRDVPCVVVLAGGGSSDTHNKGYYATPEALAEAEPTAEAGDWAIVGSTDTVWIWDTDTSAWVDSDQKGQVTSVNGQTGVVSLGINDVAPTQTGKSGYVLGTDGFVAGWVKPEIVQVSALPAASEDEVNNIYQFVGTTDVNYTNGYFYKCVSDGQNPATYSWTRVDVQPTPSGLPDQTGQSGKFLTTDGTDASWATVNALQNTATGANSLTVAGTATTQARSTNIGISSAAQGEDTIVIGYNTQSPSGWEKNVLVGNSLSQTSTSSSTAPANMVCIGHNAKYACSSVTIGDNAACGTLGVFIGKSAGGSSDVFGNTGSIAVGYTANSTKGYGIAIGYIAKTTAEYAIQLGLFGINNDANTFKVANNNGNYEIMSADGTIPTDRFTTTPVADGTYVPTLTISSGVATRTWSAPSGGGSTALSLTLASANWSNNSITVTATGVTSSNNVIVSPAPASQAAYTAAGIICTGQSAGTLTFTCTSTPSSDLTINVLII